MPRPAPKPLCPTPPDAERDLPFTLLRVATLAFDYAKAFTLPLLVYEQSSGSTLAVGIAYFVEFLPRALLSPVFGSIVDRSTGKRLVYAIEILRLALMLVWAVLGRTRYGWTISSAVSLFSGMTLVFYEATAARRLSPKALQRFQVRSQLLDPLARLVGPGGAALAIAHLSPLAAINGLALGYACVLGASFAWRGATSRPAVSTLDRWTPAEEWRRFTTLAANARLLMLTIAAGLLNVLFGVFQSLIAPIMIGHYRMPVAYSALPSFVGGSISFALCILVPRIARRRPPSDFGTLGTVSLAAAAALCALDMGPWSFCVAFGLLIVGSALYGIFFRHMRCELIPASQLAQGIGATTSVTTVFLPVAGLVTASTVGWPPVLVIGAVGLVVTAALFVSTRHICRPNRPATPLSPSDS
ncbi:MFS transporter [Burkholderia sp. SIMBA_062]|uniref:MFS transporter n=1 Tax=Burkholderia sp. SIMBA_062 TaxID=3085803 RepID=UPI00397D9701